jgi:hypothetical protein
MKNYFTLIRRSYYSAGCSDKYKSVYDSAPAPEIRFNKDVVTIREKDYSPISV